jgi:hypothetical protein
MAHRGFVADCYRRLLGRAADEALMAGTARVLQPGGILAPATAGCRRGTVGGRVFPCGRVRRIIDQPSLGLVQPIDDRLWNRRKTPPVDLRVDRFMFLEECG